MPNLKVVLKYSVGGKSTKEIHSNTFLVTGVGVYSSVAALELASDLSIALRSVLFENCYMLRASISHIGNDGRAIPDESRTVPLEGQGARAIPAGDVVADEHVVMKVIKGATGGRTGTSYFRHTITADEFAAYEKDGTVPGDIANGIAVEGDAGGTFISRLLALLTAHSYTLILPTRVRGGIVTQRPVTSVTFGGFGMNSPTRKKKSARAASADAAQRKINEYARTARELRRGDASGIMTADMLAMLVLVIADAEAIRAALPVLERARINWPDELVPLP